MRPRWLSHESEPVTDRDGGRLRNSDPALERHYSVLELAQMWGLSEKTIRRIFNNEPGVVKWGHDEGRFKRGYVTLRIPESVIQRVHRRMRQVG
jgi:AraC-like DNA-binding protein